MTYAAIVVVIVILLIPRLIDRLDALSLRRLDRDVRAIVPDWDQ